MSSEKIQQKTGLLNGVGTNIAFSGVMSGGFGSITAVKNHRGIKNAVNATKENNKVLKEYAKTLGPETDVFTKNIKTAYNYQEYTKLAKKNAKATRKLEKLQGATELPFSQKVKNLFRSKKNKIKDLNGYKAKLTSIQDSFSDATNNLKAGKNISSEVINHLDDVSSITKATKGLFKSELKDPFGIFFAGTEFFTRFTQESIPAFKNEGFIAGLKSTGKAIAAAGATWITDAGFSVVFRNVGATVGSIFGPVGMAIGSFAGNAIGGLVSCNLIQKIFPMKEQEVELAQNDVQQNIEQEQISTSEQSQVITTQNGSTMPLDKSLTPEQVKQLAYAQAFQGKVPQIGYYA